MILALPLSLVGLIVMAVGTFLSHRHGLAR